MFQKKYVLRLNPWLYPRWTFLHTQPPHRPPFPLSLSSSTHSGPSATATPLGGANLGSKQKPTIHAGAGPFFLTRSTVNCVLCPAMQMHVDQSRHDRTTPIRGLFPKPTAAPTMPRGFHGLPLFVGETKNHDQVIFYNFASPLICRTAGVITQSSDTAVFVSWRLWDVPHLISQPQSGKKPQLPGSIYITCFK